MMRVPEQFADRTLPSDGSNAEVWADLLNSFLISLTIVLGCFQAKTCGIPELPGGGKPRGSEPFSTTNCDSLLTATPFPMSAGVPVPRRRFQRGSLIQKSGRWYGVFRKDVKQHDGTFRREQCWQQLGLASEQSERSAWKQFQPFLDSVNDAALRMPPRSGLTLSEFVEEWRA